MIVRLRGDVSDEALGALHYRLRDCFGDLLSVAAPEPDSAWPGRRCIERIEVLEQDGPPIEPEPGETLLEVHLTTRYYGPGYERGDLPGILAVAAWLERAIPGCAIWYGGDSSGVCATPLDAEARERLWGHFVERGRRPYRRALCRGARVRCDFCGADADVVMWGGAYTGHHCVGCDRRWVVVGDQVPALCDARWKPLQDRVARAPS